MNKVFLMGRPTKDPEVRYSQGEQPMAIARYTLAVDRKGEGADFISCVAFGRNGEFAEKYIRKGTKIVIEGHIQTGSYTNREGVKVYTTDVVIDNQEFAESKKSMNEEDREARDQAAMQGYTGGDGFMNIPEGIDEKLPFN